MAKDHGPSVRNDKQYEGLRKKGMSKSRAAAISNSPGSSSRGGKKSGSGGGSSRSRKSSGSGSGGIAPRRRQPAARAARPRASPVSSEERQREVREQGSQPAEAQKQEQAAGNRELPSASRR